MGTNCATLLVELFSHSFEAGFRQELTQKKKESKTKHLFSASVLQMMFSYSTIRDSVIIFTSSTQMSLNKNTQQTLQSLPHTLFFISNQTMMEGFAKKYMTNVMTSIFQQSTTRLLTVIFKLPRRIGIHVCFKSMCPKTAIFKEQIGF